MHKNSLTYLASFLIVLLSMGELMAQSNPDPQGAFLRSLAVPGWGHYYADNENWNRGKYHLGADAVLIGSIFGFNARAENLQQKYITLSNLNAGVDITDKDRSFLLAIGDFNSIDEYNDFQLRSRNWNRLIEDTPENRWHWESSDDRRRFRDLRSNRDKLRNQLPVLGAFMVANRVVSAISAYNRARNRNAPEITFLPADGIKGLSAHIAITF